MKNANTQNPVSSDPKGKLYIRNVDTPYNKRVLEVCHGVRMSNAPKVLGRRNIHNILWAELVVKTQDFDSKRTFQRYKIEVPQKEDPKPRLKKKK